MNADSSFEKLLRRACARDEAAAAELVRDYGPELRRFIHFRLTDPRLRRFLDSLDICQSVLATFFVYLREGHLQLNQPRQLARLLAVMARNKLLDKIRQQQTERRGGPQANEAELEPIELLVDDRRQGPDSIEDRELVDVVSDRLSVADRQLLDRWMRGEGWAEIASACGGSPEALRKRLSRSIDQVARELGLLEEGP